MVESLPADAGDAGLIPGGGAKIPHAVGQLSPHATTTEFMPLNERAHMPQTTEPTCPGAHTPQLERSPCASTKILCATTKTRRSQKNNKRKK